MATPLPLITNLARAGALARAEALFAESGYGAATDDPAALAVKGRLLKGRALLATGKEQANLFKLSAAAYAAADAIAPAPYLLINVATLTALRGEAGLAAQVAEVVLERIAAGSVAETPYWLAATQAEALLLKGDVRGANAALAEAVAHDPDGWADHAATLRQLGQILDCQGLSKDWLIPYRPPKSLHFAGHLGVAPDTKDDLRAKVDALIAAEGIGFGYGALAAGADIVIAEALLAHGAALHVILPTAERAFIEQSVSPYDKAWLPRFRSCLKKAASVVEATRIAGHYEPRAAALASDMAMGAALLNARSLESSAIQLLVIDEGAGPYGDGAYSARDGNKWAKAGNRQIMLRTPRDGGVAASARKQEGRADRRLAAMLHLSFDGLDALDDWAFAHVLDGELTPFLACIAALPSQGAHVESWGNARVFAFDDVATATSFALSLNALNPPLAFAPVIAGHYGLVHDVGGALTGPGVAALMDLKHAAIPGSITVSEPFATSLAIAVGEAVHTEFVGSQALAGTLGDTRLFALSA